MHMNLSRLWQHHFLPSARQSTAVKAAWRNGIASDYEVSHVVTSFGYQEIAGSTPAVVSEV